MTRCQVLAALALLASPPPTWLYVVADFDDYVDPTFNCPAMTTCPVGCVSDLTLCPQEQGCGSNETLCNDGSCAPAGENCDESLESPCELDCASLACAKVVTYFDECSAIFESAYTAEAECAAAEEASEAKLARNEPGLVFLYTWICVITALVFGWCAFNQRWRPVDGSTRELVEAAKEVASSTNQALIASPYVWSQTAYRSGIIGMIIHALTIATLWGFQVLLLLLTIFYYMQQEAITRWNTVFESEVQVLIVFQIVWTVGIIWSFTMRWPESVHSIFLRRCNFRDATHIAVFVPYAEAESVEADHKTPRYIDVIKRTMGGIRSFFSSLFAFLFSDVSRPNIPGEMRYCPVNVEGGNKSFVFRLRRYNYNAEEGRFVPGVWKVGDTISDFLLAKEGLSSEEIGLRRSNVGNNDVAIKKPNLLKEIAKEFHKPFYLYQGFMIWTWAPFWYYYMAILYSIIRFVGGVVVGYFQYRNMRNLYRLTHASNDDVDVLRDGALSKVSQKELVPGDVVFIEPGISYCDMVLVSDGYVLVDESALTGEATPVAKMALDPSEASKTYDVKSHKRHTIFAGTTILETNELCKTFAVVTKTGSFTSKGEMLRDILSYRRHNFKFDVEVEIVIVILLLYAILGFVLVATFLDDSPVYAWFYGMYVVGTALPTLLPTVFVVSVGISDQRLSRKSIACSNSEGILVAGKVSLAFFDKTGTLTKQGLDFLSTRSAEHWGDEGVNSLSADLALGMSVCHSLTMSAGGNVIGNSVDTMMFKSVGATMQQDDSNSMRITDSSGNVMTVLKRFEFDHHRATQSVIVKDNAGAISVFVKGSAESITKRCEPSKLPADFDSATRASAREGIYQISMAKKILSSSQSEEAFDMTDITRDDIESGLTFVGFVNFKNVMKEDTPFVIHELEEGDVRCIMVTGDSLLTGIHIASESGMIKPSRQIILGQEVTTSGAIHWVDWDKDEQVALPSLRQLLDPSSNVELAVTGAVWASLVETSPELSRQLMHRIRVFGRCTPLDKVSVVSSFVQDGYVTLMCGDGGNDCGALKTAHVGIALSDSDASMVAPFTSIDKSITSVVEVLKEGRCALASAFASYKYMIMYGQIETFLQISGAYLRITFYEWNWVFMDGAWVITMAFTLPLAKAAKKLAPRRPTSSLLDPHTMSSFLGVYVLNIGFIVTGLVLLYHQDWFQCRKWNNTDVSDSNVIGDNYESTVLFIIGGYQYIASAAAYNFGFVFRAAWIRNYCFVLFFIGWTTIQLYITLVPSKLSCLFRVNCSNDDVVRGVTSPELLAISNVFNTSIMPLSFRWTLVGIMGANLIAIMGYEFWIVNGPVGRKLASRYASRKGQQKQVPAKNLEQEKRLTDSEFEVEEVGAV